MSRTSKLVASIVSSAFLLVVTDVRAQSTHPVPPPQAAPAQPSAPAPDAAPPQAPPPQAPPPYVTPAPQPYAGQPQAYPPPPGYPQQVGHGAPLGWRPPPPARPSKGLMITGISIFAGSYLVAMLVGGALLDNNADGDDDDDFDCRHCSDVAPYLFIPLAGPFVAMSKTPNDGGLIVLGLVEMVGAALTIGGIVRYRNTKRAAELSGYSLDLGGRRTLSLDVGSAQRTVGPRMTLRF